jgi:gas vesicle protein
MSDNGGSETGAFLAGFLVGGLVGAATALILAPQSGERTRTQIREKGIELRDRAEDLAEDARVRAERLAEEAQLRAEEAVGEARKRADELQQHGRQVYQEQRTRLTSAVEEGKKAAVRKKEELLGSQAGKVELPAQPAEPAA